MQESKLTPPPAGAASLPGRHQPPQSDAFTSFEPIKGPRSVCPQRGFRRDLIMCYFSVFLVLVTRFLGAASCSFAWAASIAFTLSSISPTTFM